MEEALKTISCAELKQRLTAAPELLLIDVLPKTRYQQVHLPDAANACVFEVTFLDQVAGLTASKDVELVVYGASARSRDAITAATKLQRTGYRQVSILDGGLAAWQEGGLPLEGENTIPALPERQIADGRYRIDTDASVIAWAGRNPNSTHHGTLQLETGEIMVNGGLIKGEFSIDMTTIKNLNLAGDELQPVLEAHLKSDDFFYVSRFPRARYRMTATPTGAELPVSAPNYSVSGQLTLCGFSTGQEFLATIVATEDGRLSAEAHFDFDRTRWGVIYGSTKFFEHLGMHLVFDLISLQLRIVTGEE